MKRFLNTILPLCILIFLLVLLPTLLQAQGGGDPGCDTLDPGCPIDGGLTALLAVGVGYGIKKVRDSGKSES